MMPTRHATLGIAVQDKGLLLAEARPSDASGTVHEAAHMTIPEGGLPAVAGQLRAFLHEHGVHTKRVVVGVTARWVVCREMAVPPVDKAQLAGLLRIRAEREIAADVGKLVTDYARAEGGPAEGSVLLVAMLGEHLDQIKQMCEQAGLKLAAVVPTVMVLAASAPAPGCHVVLSLREDGTDVAILTGGQFRVVRDVPATDAGSLSTEIRRMLAPMSGSSDQAAGRVTVWGEPPEGLIAQLAERLGMEVAPGQGLPSARLAKGAAPAAVASEAPAAEAAPAAAAAPGPLAFAGAVALAMSGSNPAVRPVDFMASRLAEVRKFHLGRGVVWAVIAALIVIGGATALIVDWRLSANELAQLKKDNEARKPEIDKAQTVVDRVTHTRGWYDKRPPILDCLRALTLAFPQDGRIWTRSLALKDDMKCVVDGRSSDEGLTLQLRDALEKSPQFKDVKFLYVRGGQGTDQTFQFSISFTFVASE